MYAYSWLHRRNTTPKKLSTIFLLLKTAWLQLKLFLYENWFSEVDNKLLKRSRKQYSKTLEIICICFIVLTLIDCINLCMTF